MGASLDRRRHQSSLPIPSTDLFQSWQPPLLANTLFRQPQNELSPFHEGFENFLAHVASDNVPIILLHDYRLGSSDDRTHFFWMLHDVLDLRCNLFGRIFIDSKPSHWLIGIALLIEKKVRNATFLCRDDRQAGRHRLDERIAHAL